MSEFKAMKFWIGDDPELSEKVQKLLFGMGYTWAGGHECGSFKRGVMIATKESGAIWHRDNFDSCFDSLSNEEINIDWMRTNKPETIELAGKTYIKSELEEALRHIKPV